MTLRARPASALAGLVVLTIALTLGAAWPADAPAADPTPACATPDGAGQETLMQAYEDRGSFPARQVDARRGLPAGVTVRIPPIAFTGPGESSTLPVGPCQTIYRFDFSTVGAQRGATATPFSYVEVDWNTEGVPRGPNGAFASPHFDFHFYLRSRAAVDHHTMCVSTNGRTCDQQRTGYAQMRRFLDLPPAPFVPRGYFPDVGSSIPMMGLHLLDGRFDYTLDSVNHHPTLIYGTFDGRVLFAEASVTLFTLQDAMTAPGGAISFPYRQPQHVRGALPWPTRFVIRYERGSGTFRVGFERFRR
jgi:hypothetical protein